MKKHALLFSIILLSLPVWAQVPNWSEHVAPIVYANCTSCHRPGGIAPFPLLSYQQAAPMAGAISWAVGDKHMPPWTPDPNYKRFVHERTLTQAEITAIQQWAANGAPSGDLRFAPPAPSYSTSSQLGSVDLSVQIPTFTVPTNSDVYRNFVIPSGLAQTRFANAVEIAPGNPGIVHHVLVFTDTTNNPINPTSAGGTGSNASKLIAGFTPGSQPYYTPVGTGLRLPANTRIIVQVHYAPGSLGQTDSTRINFKLSTGSLRQIRVDPILNHFTNMTNGPLFIPAGQTRTFHEQASLPGNWTFLTAFPHMHLIGRSIISYAVNPSTMDTIRFVKIPEWDFHWQDAFVFPNAVKVPNGYTLRATAFYDNTSNNPHNPFNPPQNITAGENTHNEMMMVFFAYMPYQPGDEYLIIDRRIIPKGATTFCNGQSVLLKTIEGMGYTYQWLKDGTPIAGATGASYTATQQGSYTVSISLGPNNAVSDPVVVTVNSTPVASITPPPSTVIASGGSIVLQAATGPGYSYQWYKNGSAIPGATSATYPAANPGSYEVEVYTGCYAVSAPVTLTTNAATFTVSTSVSPVAGGTANGGGTYISGNTATLSATPAQGYAFTNWTENGNVLSTSNPYSFSVTDNRSVVANFTFVSGFEDAAASPDIAVFPNPSTGAFSLRTDSRYEVRAYNCLGQLVLSKNLEAGDSQLQMPAQGIYQLQFIRDGKIAANRRVMVGR